MLVFLLSQINKVFAFGFMCAIDDSNLRFAIEVFKLSIYLQLILCTTADGEVIVFKSNLHLGRVRAHTLPYLCPHDSDGCSTMEQCEWDNRNVSVGAILWTLLMTVRPVGLWLLILLYFFVFSAIVLSCVECFEAFWITKHPEECPYKDPFY